MATFEKREFMHLALLTVFTLGFYSIYWAIVTKRELNRAGADIPSSILLFIPIANLYFWYRYAQNYAYIVKKDRSHAETLLYFLVGCLPLISALIGATRLFSSELTTLVSFMLRNSNLNYMIATNGHISFVAGSIGTIVIMAIIIAKLIIFQEGYNDYKF